jgi:hypothetical protein
MSKLEEAMDRLAEARLDDDRLRILDARLHLAKCYLSEGYHQQAQKHLEIVSLENAFWKAEAARVLN